MSVLTVDDHNLGTPESSWLEAGVLDGLAPMRWLHPRRVVVVAPHPDDEILGVGGSLRSLARTGAELEIVSVTDGESSHPGSVAMRPAELARARTAETGAALRRLGVHPQVTRLGHPDGSVAAHLDQLTAQLADLLDEDTVCLSTWRHDGHPDHDACGLASLAAATADRGPTDRVSGVGLALVVARRRRRSCDAVAARATARARSGCPAGEVRGHQGLRHPDRADRSGPGRPCRAARPGARALPSVVRGPVRDPAGA